MRLAIEGGPKAVKEPIPRFNTIGSKECAAALEATSAHPLSGFLGGKLFGGYHVIQLEDAWAEKFKVKHAIACNSATSGLLLACMAAGVGRYTNVIVPAYTMSATASAPAFLGADIHFGDIYEDTFCLNRYPSKNVTAVIPVNLFGQPAHLAEMREASDAAGCCMIEDNAQAIFAKEGDKYAGTMGHIGVFSLNVHKHLQCGEGGICTTNDDSLAEHIRFGLNHGELAGGPIGLNLRMTEVTAAIALEQLLRGEKIVAERREIAEQIIEASCLPEPVGRPDCTHSYYIIPWLVPHRRQWIVDALRAEGVPVKAGYTTPLYRLPAFKGEPLPVTERVEAEIVTYENCQFSPTTLQLKQFKEAFSKVAEAVVAHEKV